MHAASDQGQALIARLNDRFQMAGSACREKVAAIIEAIKTRGDEALIAYTNQFDSPTLTIDHLRVSEAEFQAAPAAHVCRFGERCQGNLTSRDGRRPYRGLVPC